MTRYMAIIGIVIEFGPEFGNELDYCREEIFDAPDSNIAWSLAESLVDNTPKPQHGRLFVRRIETWN